MQIRHLNERNFNNYQFLELIIFLGENIQLYLK